MRIPHYLHKAPSGVFHFRRRMPSCLHALIGRPVIKKSLLTRDVGVARGLALKLWRAYDELHQHVSKAFRACASKMRGEGQRTKNHSSNRIIPVHPELIKMGLLKKSRACGRWVKRACSRRLARVP